MNPAIIEQLKTQYQILDSQIATATAERDRIAGAIAALEGKAVPSGPVQAASGPPVTSLILEAALALDPSATFDYKSIKDKAQRDFPSQAVRIKTGVYTAVTTLIKQGKVVRVPGGFAAKR